MKTLNELRTLCEAKGLEYMGTGFSGTPVFAAEGKETVYLIRITDVGWIAAVKVEL